ncbi:MAG: ROK family protein [Brevinema sp.]
MLVCIDIGGTSIKYGVASEDTSQTIHFYEQKEMPTEAKLVKGMGILQKVFDIISEMRLKYDVEGVAISTAGMVDHIQGAIIYANDNIPEYTGINLKQAVESQFNLPCWVENDVNAAALGEYAYGAAKGSSSVLCLTIGTGIGGAIILDGQVYRGSSLSAGEVGYMTIKGDMFEKLGSTSALVQRVQDRLPNEANIDGKFIFEEAQKGNICCLEEIDAMCDTLAQGIASIACVLNPQTVVLGGGIMAQKSHLLPRIRLLLAKYLPSHIHLHTEITVALLSNTAGMAGAFAFWKQQNI